MNSDRSYSVFARYYDLLTENVDYEARAAYLDELIRRLHPVEDCVLLEIILLNLIQRAGIIKKFAFAV